MASVRVRPTATGAPRYVVPLTFFPAADLLDPEPLPPVEFEKPTRKSSLRGKAIPRRG